MAPIFRLSTASLGVELLQETELPASPNNINTHYTECGLHFTKTMVTNWVQKDSPGGKTLIGTSEK